MRILAAVGRTIDRFANESKMATGTLVSIGDRVQIGQYEIPAAETPRLLEKMKGGEQDVGFWYRGFRWARVHNHGNGIYSLYLRDEKPLYEKDAA